MYYIKLLCFNYVEECIASKVEDDEDKHRTF